MERRDSRARFSSSMEEYLADYGFHFNRKLFEFAVGMMEDKFGQKIKPWDKEKTESVLKTYGIKLDRDTGYDAAYAINMARADYYGSSVIDEAHLAMFVKDYLDDKDGAESRAFDEFYIKTVALGVPVFWEDML